MLLYTKLSLICGATLSGGAHGLHLLIEVHFEVKPVAIAIGIRVWSEVEVELVLTQACDTIKVATFEKRVKLQWAG